MTFRISFNSSLFISQLTGDVHAEAVLAALTVLETMGTELTPPLYYAELFASGGRREVLIPDIMIGANASDYAGRLLTTNPRDFFKAFATLARAGAFSRHPHPRCPVPSPAVRLSTPCGPGQSLP